MNFKFAKLDYADFPLMLKWLKTAHVHRWWNPEITWTAELIQKRYGDYVNGYKRLTLSDGIVQKIIEKPVSAFIMMINDERIGYIQLYNAYDFPRAQGGVLRDLPKNLAAIDLFIGETQWTGKGIGPILITEFAEKNIFKDYDAVFVDPKIENIHAIKAYRKAGFKEVESYAETDVVWMVLEKTNDIPPLC